MSRCYQGGRRHKFGPRYSEVDSAIAKNGMSIKVTGVDIQEMFKNRVYVHDVCEWCGKIAEKQKEQ